MASNDIVLTVRAKDKASGTFDVIQGKAKGLGSALSGALRAGALAGGVAIAGLGAAALKMAVDFESSFAEVKTLLPTLSDEGFNKLRDDLLDLSQEMGIATDQAVPALYQAISAGVPPDNVIDFMRTASMAAVGGVTDLETAVDGITSVVNAYGTEAISAQQASDLMFTAVRLGKTDFTQLSSSLFNVIPTAASLSIGMEEVAASLATITAQGTPTSVATTSLRAAFVEASKGGTKLDAAIRDLTGKGLGELTAAGKTSQGVLNALRNSMPEQEFKDLFGSVEAMNAVLQITGPNAESFIKNLREMGDSAGATEAAFGTISETTSFKLNKAINILKIELMKLGAEALPLLVQGLEAALPFLQEKVPAAIESAKQGFKAIKPTLELLVSAFVTGLKTIKEAVEPVFNFIVSNKVTLVAAITAIGVAILVALGPGAVAIAALLGLIVVIGLVRDNFDEIKAKVGEFADAIPGLNTALGLAEEAIGDVITFIENIVTVVEDVIELISALASGDWSRAWGELKEVAVGILNLFISWLSLGFIDEIVTAIVGGVPKLLSAGGDLFQGLIDGIMDKWDNVLKLWYVDLPLLILDTIGDLIETLAPVGFDLLIGLLNGVKDAFEIALKLYFVDFPMLVFDTIGDVTGTLFDLGKDLFQGLFDGIKEHWQTILLVFFLGLPAAILLAIGALLSLLKPLGKDLLQGLADGIQVIWSGILSFFKSLPGLIVTAIGDVTSKLWQKGKDLIQGFIDGILSVPIPNPLDLIPDLTPGFDVPGIPGFHSGGIVPGPAGRNRLIVAQGGEAVLTPGQQRSGGFGGGGVTIQIVAPNALVVERNGIKALMPEFIRQMNIHQRGSGGLTI